MLGPSPSAPVSTSTMFLPVSITRQMYGLIHSSHFSGSSLCVWSACARSSFWAFANRNIGGGGKVGGLYVKVPSLTTVQSKTPILNR